MPARDFDMWDQKPPFELDPSRWPDGDYGEGTTKLQDAYHSKVMFGKVLLYMAAVILFAVGVALYRFVF